MNNKKPEEPKISQIEALAKGEFNKGKKIINRSHGTCIDPIATFSAEMDFASNPSMAQPLMNPILGDPSLNTTPPKRETKKEKKKQNRSKSRCLHQRSNPIQSNHAKPTEATKT